MNTSHSIQLALEDLLADLHHARRQGDLGRLALLAYCEVRGWARRAGMPDISDGATRLFTENPSVSRDEFLAKIDTLITALELHQRPVLAACGPMGCPPGPACSPFAR